MRLRTSNFAKKEIAFLKFSLVSFRFFRLPVDEVKY